MRIQSEDGSNFIELIQQGVDFSPYYYPSTIVQIEGHADGFSACSSNVWLSANDMHQFLTELIRLEQLRSGTASLVSMDPKTTLSLEIIDRAGHMIAKLDLTRHAPSSYPWTWPQHLSITFEIDVSLLPRLVKHFEQMIPREEKE